MTHTSTSGLLSLALLVLVLTGCGDATGTPSVSNGSNGEAAAPADNEPADEEPIEVGQVSETQTDQAVAAEGQPSLASTTGEIVDITFDDLNCGIQADVVFRPWMLTDRANELNGRRIRVVGFMLPDVKQSGIVHFILLRNSECKFGAGGKADHLIQVKLQDGVTAAYKGDRPLEVVGTLQINPFQGPDGFTWCIYDLAGESVEWKRR